MLPRIILHNTVSLDGRIDWFNPDVGLHYELASRWNFDAHLAGSNTIFNPAEAIPEEDEETFKPQKKDPNDKRPLLVVPDSRGRVRNWHVLRKAAYWRDMIALCVTSTPKKYLDYLQERHINYIIAGNDHVHLRKALEELNSRYGVKLILLDSGGTLNGILLREGLVDEVSILISPFLIGGTSLRSIFRARDLTSVEGVIRLKLLNVEKMKDDIIWLRYKVIRKK
jgi:2,5-diamino-6-(ribosylamino)-4(3H)-pyrimidinone 5'-phosphate reductase